MACNWLYATALYDGNKQSSIIISIIIIIIINISISSPFLYHASNLADKLRQFSRIVNLTYQVQLIEAVQQVKVHLRWVCVQLAQIKLKQNKIRLSCNKTD